MDRIKVGEYPYQNSRVEHGILGRHAVKAMPIQGIQMRSQVMLNVASVILKGIKTNEISENLPSLFRSTSKKRKKEEINVNGLGKNYKENAKFTGKDIFKINYVQFQMNTHRNLFRAEYCSETCYGK